MRLKTSDIRIKQRYIRSRRSSTCDEWAKAGVGKSLLANFCVRVMPQIRRPWSFIESKRSRLSKSIALTNLHFFLLENTSFNKLQPLVACNRLCSASGTSPNKCLEHVHVACLDIHRAGPGESADQAFTSLHTVHGAADGATKGTTTSSCGSGPLNAVIATPGYQVAVVNNVLFAGLQLLWALV